MVPWFTQQQDGVLLALYVQPGAKRTELVGAHGQALKLRLMAPPQEGKANAALLNWLAKRFNLSLRSVQLVAGEKSRQKRVWIGRQLSADEILCSLSASKR